MREFARLKSGAGRFDLLSGFWRSPWRWTNWGWRGKRCWRRFRLFSERPCWGSQLRLDSEDRIWRGARWRDIWEIRPKINTKSRSRCNALDGDGEKYLWPRRVLAEICFL